MYRILFVVIIFPTISLGSSQVDVDLLWSLCKEPKGGVEYCQKIEQIKENQIQFLESQYFRYTENWQRNFLTLIYYGISEKIPIEHSIDKNHKIYLFIKKEDVTFKYSYSF